MVASHDGEPDRLRISFIYDLLRLLINKPKESGGFGAFGGNFIMIKVNGYYVLLCHLMAGSLAVNKGEVVAVGQPIARAGNSGSSIQPHLHIQVMKNSDYFPLFKSLLPFRISNAWVKRGDGWKSEQDIKLQSGGNYRFGE